MRAKKILRTEGPLYDYDWSSLLVVIRAQLLNMEYAIFDKGYSIHPKSHRKAMKIAIHLCNRLINENYERSPFVVNRLAKRPSDIRLVRIAMKQEHNKREYDKRLLMRIMRRYLFYWWD